MDAFEYYYLLGFGLLLIGIDVLIFSFYLLWIGLGLIVLSLITLVYPFDSAVMQIALAVIIGLILLLVFKKPLEKTMKAHDDSEKPIHTTGMGVVSDGVIKMDGTYWQTTDDLSDLEDGDTVEVFIKENKAFLVK